MSKNGSDGTASMGGSDSSYEVIDYSENPLFLILSAIFHDEDGNTICDYLDRLVKAVDRNTSAINAKRSKHSRPHRKL